MTEDFDAATKAKTDISKFSVNLLILLAVFIGCLAILFAVADYVFTEKNTALDNMAFDIIAGHVHPELTSFMQFITLFGGHIVLLPANLLLLTYFLINKPIRFWTWKIAVIAVTGVIILFSLKYILERERPLVPLITKAHGFSFPSGHAFSSCVFYGMLAYISYHAVPKGFWRYFTVAGYIALIILIGYSRVYLRVHYATDVIAGFMLGIIWLLLAKWLLIDRRKNFPHDTRRVV